MKKLVIAIDGPAGAGKSTVAQMAAKKLNYTYIDTGAMYRAVAWKALQNSKGGQITEDVVRQAVMQMKIQLQYISGKTFVIVDGKDVTDAIRTPEVTKQVSAVAQLAIVREKLVEMQRKMASAGGVVMDGRDICMHVLPNADVKLFLTASIKERALRRWKEMQSKGYKIELATLESEIAARDKADSEREISPLIQADDAVLLDTTSLSIDEVVEKILSFCERDSNVV